MPRFHDLQCTSSPGGLTFECEVCGRRLVVDRATGELTVIDRGEPGALHRGGIGDVDLGVPVVSTR